MTDDIRRPDKRIEEAGAELIRELYDFRDAGGTAESVVRAMLGLVEAIELRREEKGGVHGLTTEQSWVDIGLLEQAREENKRLTAALDCERETSSRVREAIEKEWLDARSDLARAESAEDMERAQFWRAVCSILRRIRTSRTAGGEEKGDG